MRNLLIADFRRVLRDKLLLVMGILAVVFAFFNPVIYAGLYRLMGLNKEDVTLMAEAMGEMEYLGAAFPCTAKHFFFMAFSLSDNLGLVAPVLLAIALWKDFSYGTVRNKIIAGKRRSSIFMSLFITCAVVLIYVMLLHAFSTLLVSLVFFDYQAAPFTFHDFLYFIQSLAYEILVYLYVAAMIAWLCASMKNVGLVIVFYIAFTLVFSIAGAIIQSISMFMVDLAFVLDIDQWIVDLIHFLDRINVETSTMYIGSGTIYTVEDMLYLSIPAILGIFGFLILGLWRFSKKDLK